MLIFFFSISDDLQKVDQDSFGFRLENGSFTGTIGRLSDQNSDIALTGFFIKDYLTPHIEFTPSLYSDDLCCIVPKSAKLSPLILPLACFENSVWLLLFITTILCGSFWSFLRLLNELYIVNKTVDIFNRSFKIKNGSKYVQFFQIIIDCFIIVLSAPLRRFPKVTSERLFLSSICMISLIFVSIFQSGLSSVFIKPMYYKDIDTLVELDNSNFSIHLKHHAMLDDLFLDSNSTMKKNLRNKLVLSPRSSMSRLVYRTNEAYITRKSTTKLSNEIYFLNNQLHLVKECPILYNIGFVFPKNSVFKERINEILLNLLNGGFMEKWIKDMYYTTTLRHIKDINFQYQNFKILNLSDMQLPFCVLGCGLIISIFVLLMEKMYSKY